jgi:methylthioribose-1-phosphate isomerase
MQAANPERRASGDDAAGSGLWWDGRALHLLDQTELPARERWLRYDSVEDVVRAIERLAVRDWADGVVAEETARDDALIANSVELFGSCCRALTHCNTGRLATASHGTAIGAIEAAFRDRRPAHVWLTERRPLLQGARLTAWELGRAGVPHTLITDGSVGEVMRQGMVDAVIVGADRVAANSDVANKIGTHAIAASARIRTRSARSGRGAHPLRALASGMIARAGGPPRLPCGRSWRSSRTAGASSRPCAWPA